MCAAAPVPGRTRIPRPGRWCRRWRPDPRRLSADGRTYTFAIADGFAFSPPSNEAITAETYAFALERALSPVFGVEAQGPSYIDDIQGLAAYRARRSDHISGVRVQGDTLSITLLAPSETFLQRLAAPSFCPVPLDSPIVAGGVTDYTGAGLHIPPFASAGPYYVSYHLNGELTILRTEPELRGRSRRHRSTRSRCARASTRPRPSVGSRTVRGT